MSAQRELAKIMNLKQILEEWSDIEEESDSDESSDSEESDNESVSGSVDAVWREVTGECLPVLMFVKKN